MPVSRMASGRVTIESGDDGNIRSVRAKCLSSKPLIGLLVFEDLYNDYDERQLGKDELGRRMRYGFENGGYIYDVETVEAYANALHQFAQQIKRRQREYADANNIPVTI